MPGDEVVPGYTLDCRLGAGGVGDVWRARAAGGIDVAVKIVRRLSEIGGRKELRALRTIRNIKHPNLCTLHGFWVKDADGRILADGELEDIALESSVAGPAFSCPGGQQPTGDTMAVGSQWESHWEVMDDARADEKAKAEQLIVVMQLGDGTLYDQLQVVRQQAGLSPDDTSIQCGMEPKEVLSYLRGAADAIDLLHRDEIYHLDIKPQNILLVGGGSQVCDFGLVKRIQKDNIRATRQVFATLGYAAPEVLRNSEDEPIGRGADQYSLAVTYFELRTGMLPYRATTNADVMAEKLTGKIELRRVTTAERKVLQRALNRNQDHRYPTCVEFIRAMAIATGVEGGSIPWKKLMVAASMVGLLSLGAWHGWSLAHPESHRSVLSWIFGERPTAGDRIDSIAKDWDDHHNDQQVDFNVARERLRRMLNDLRFDAELQESSTEIQEQARDLSDKISNYFLDLILKHIREFDDSSQSNDRLRVSLQEDLERIDSMLRENLEDDRFPTFDPSSDTGRKLKARTALAQLAMNLWFDNSTDPRLQDAASVSVPSLRSMFDVLSENEQHLAALSLALANRREDATPILDSTTLDDLARAHQLVSRQASQNSTYWYAREWYQLERDSIPMLQEKLENPATPANQREKIRQVWPDLALRSSLALLGRSIRDGSWDESFQRHDDMTREIDFESLEEKDLLDQCRVFELLLRGLRDLARAADAIDDARQFLEHGGATRELLRDTAEPWVLELLRRNASLRRERKAIDEIESVCQENFAWSRRVYQSSVPFFELLDISIPAELVHFVLTDAIALGPSCLDEEDVQRAIEDAADETSQFLANAVQVEQAYFHPRGGAIDGGLVRRLNQQRHIVAQDRDLLTRLPVTYLHYLDGILLHSRGEKGAAADAWDRCRHADGSVLVRSTLGPRRCLMICQELLRLATDESGVKDDDVLQRRFVIASEERGEQVRRARTHVLNAEWWSGELDPAFSRGTLEDLAIQQQLLALGQQADPGVAPPGSAQQMTFNQSLRELIEISVQDPGERNRSYGQLYRGGLEFAKRRFQVPLAARRPYQEQLQRFLLASAVGVLDVGIGDKNINRALIREVLEPTMSVVYPTLRREPDSADAFDSGLLARFLTHYMKTYESDVASDFYARGDSEERVSFSQWLSSLELSAATLANNRDFGEVDRAHLLLKAAEFCRQDRQRQEGGIDASAVRLLRDYVSRARKLKHDNPAADVMEAFALLYESDLQGSDTARVALLDESHQLLEQAIQVLLRRAQDTPKSRDIITLYDAYWSNGNVLVQRAFYRGGRNERKRDLSRAKECAAAAESLLDKELGREGGILKNAAYMTLGNSCEDLALYCLDRPEDLSERRRHFREAIRAFNKAVDLTLVDPLKQQIYLSRCLMRYVETCQLDTEESLNQLLFAKKELSDKPEIGRGLKIEWFWLRSRIEELLGNETDAKDFARQGYEQALELDEVEQLEERDHMIVYYAGFFLDKDPHRTLQIIERVQNLDRAAYWSWLELRVRALRQIGQPKAVANEVLSDEFKARGQADVNRDAERVMPVLARLVRVLQEAAIQSQQTGDTDTFNHIGRAIQSIRLVCEAELDAADSRPYAVAYQMLVLAHANAVSEKPTIDEVIAVSNAIEMVDHFGTRDSPDSLEGKRVLLDMLLFAMPSVEAIRAEREKSIAAFRQAGEKLRANVGADGQSVIGRQARDYLKGTILEQREQEDIRFLFTFLEVPL